MRIYWTALLSQPGPSPLRILSSDRIHEQLGVAHRELLHPQLDSHTRGRQVDRLHRRDRALEAAPP
jgi:hypothetical protein